MLCRDLHFAWTHLPSGKRVRARDFAHRGAGPWTRATLVAGQATSINQRSPEFTRQLRIDPLPGPGASQISSEVL